MENPNASSLRLPNVDEVAQKVHESWRQSKIAVGVKHRLLESGEDIMVPWENLSEEAKDQDRLAVKTVYEAIEVHP